MVVLDAEIKRCALEATRVLSQVGKVRATYVFGSHVEGRADQWSDIDIAVFMDDVESWDFEHRIQVFIKVQMDVGFDVEPHLFPTASLHNAEAGSFAADIIKRGIRILGE